MRSDGIYFVEEVLSAFLDSLDSSNPPTIKDLVNSLPKVITDTYGHLADIYMNQCKVLTYKTIKEVFEAHIELGILRLSENDNIDDFNTDKNLLAEVVNLIESRKVK